MEKQKQAVMIIPTFSISNKLTLRSGYYSLDEEIQ
jgi:hypothetical protein